MGRKLKSGKGTFVRPVELANGETDSRMGVSKKSKKIKKQKANENLTRFKNVVKGAGPTVECKKDAKHILSQEDESSIEPQPVNGSNGISKKFKQTKLPVPMVQSHQVKQELKTKQKKNKPEANISGAGCDNVLMKTKKKRKALEMNTGVNVDVPKKHKKNTDSVKNQSDDINVEPQMKHKKNEIKQEQEDPRPTKAKVKKHAKSIEVDKDVLTSESDSGNEQNGDSNDVDKINQNISERYSKANGTVSTEGDEGDKKVKDTLKIKHFNGPEHSIFIGNLPNTVKKSTMKSMFMPYGKILSIRFRSNDGITLFKKKDRKEAKALNCYIRFEARKEAEAACATNGLLVEGNRIRVTMHMQKQMGHSASTIFVGNINHNTTDNELYDFFSRVGELEYVRQISGKGVGYVCFKKGVSIAKALKLNQQLLKGRPLRIGKLDPTKQEKRKNKKGNLVAKTKFPRSGGADGHPAKRQNHQQGDQIQKTPVREFHGALANTKSNKKRKHIKKGGSVQKKKLLAVKLTTGSGSRQQ